MHLFHGWIFNQFAQCFVIIAFLSPLLETFAIGELLSAKGDSFRYSFLQKQNLPFLKLIKQKNSGKFKVSRKCILYLIIASNSQFGFDVS